MGKFFVSGLFVTLVGVLIGFFTSNWDYTLIVSLIAGLGPLLIAGMMSGAFVSGDRNRANFNTQHKEDREPRHQFMERMLLFALPNVVTVILIFVIAAGLE